jgi:hypothetical protein
LGRRNDVSFLEVDEFVVIVTPEDCCDGDDVDACDNSEFRLAELCERISRRGECDDDPENFDMSSPPSSYSS